METTLDQKLIRLAFDPSAPEGEAINAFLMYRKKYAKIPFLSAEQPKPKQKPTISWRITLAAKNFDGLLVILSTWKKTPYYVINIIEDRRKLYDTWQIQLICEFADDGEKAQFNKYFDKAFDALIS